MTAAGLEVEFGWRGRGIALAALGAAVLGRSAFAAFRTDGIEPIEMQTLVFLALVADESSGAIAPVDDASGHGETRESLALALACDHDDVSSAVWSLARDGLITRPEVLDDEERVVLTPEGVAVIEEWLELVTSLFVRWPPDAGGVDDATG